MHSSINRHLGCFCMLAIVNKATTYIGCTYFFQISVFTLSNYTWVKLLNQRAILFLIFWETSTLLSIMAAPIYNPTYSTQGFLFSTFPPTFSISCLFDISYSNKCEGISHCHFDLRFLDDYWSWVMSTFHELVGPCMSRKILFHPLPIFLMDHLLFSFMSFLYILGSNSLSDILFANTFSIP